MSNGIRLLPRYHHGGPHTKEEFAAFRAHRARIEENRRRAMAGERDYASIGPRLPWAERVAAQVRSVPRRINRALQPETAEETAALVGASMVPGVGEGIDIADIIAGMRTWDIPRMGWGAAGFALPFVAGSTLRKMAKRGASKWSDFRLPMDEASVARRANEQGYEELLHGSKSLSPDAPLDLDRPFFQTSNPDVAGAYGAERRVYSRKPDQITFDAEGAPWNEIPLENIRRQVNPDRLEEFDQLVEAFHAHQVNKGYVLPTPEGHMDTDALSIIAREMGHSGFDARNLRDAPWTGATPTSELADVPSFVRSTVDPGLVRYEGARFDPRYLGQNLPLSGIAGLLGVGAAGAARRNYVER